MHIFSPIDFKYTKLQQKSMKIFPCGAHPLFIKNFSRGKKTLKKGGEGQTYEFQINLIYTPGVYKSV